MAILKQQVRSPWTREKLSEGSFDMLARTALQNAIDSTFPLSLCALVGIVDEREAGQW